MKTSLRGGDDRGVYAIYWEHEKNKHGSTDLSIVLPQSDKTPQEIKLMILQGLLTDLKIPIEIKDYMLKDR